MKKEEKQALSIVWKYNAKKDVSKTTAIAFMPNTEDIENQIPLNEMTRKEMEYCYNVLVTLSEEIRERIEEWFIR